MKLSPAQRRALRGLRRDSGEMQWQQRRRIGVREKTIPPLSRRPARIAGVPPWLRPYRLTRAGRVVLALLDELEKKT